MPSGGINRRQKSKTAISAAKFPKNRTQLATITLAVTHHPVGVVLGATLGHAICAAIAVLCGKFCAGKLSERWLTGLSGALFMLFGAIAALDAL